MHIHSIRFRLIGWYSLIALVSFAALETYAYFEVRHFLHLAQLTTLDKRAQRLGNTLLSQVDTMGEDSLRKEIHDRFTPEDDDRFIRILRPDGTILYTSGEPASKAFDPRRIDAPDTLSTRAVYSEVEVSPDFTLLILIVPYKVDHRVYWIEMGGSTVFQEQVLRSLLAALLVGLPLLVVIATGGGFFLLNLALAPVRQITDAVGEITRKKLDTRLPVPPTGDEIESLSRTLNDMLSRLHEAAEHAARFSSDASHELRTPLTILRGELEALIQKPIDPREGREKLGSILEEVERLTKIVQDLFAISHLDAGEAWIESQRFDFADLVEATTEQMAPLAVEKGLSLSLKERPSADLSVNGDRARMKQVIVNLLDNAIKYTPQEGTVAVSLSVDDASRSAILEVADTGVGIPPDDLPFIFDRFYRSKRVRTGSIGGAGLGLSIVRSICSAHGGTVAAENRPAPERGALFRITLPLANPSNLEESHERIESPAS